MLKFSRTIIGVSILVSSIASANTLNNIDPHISGTISLQEPSQTNWKLQFTPLTEAKFTQFTDESGATIIPNTFIPIHDSFQYGFSFTQDADFDITFSIIAVSQDTTPAIHRGNPKCIFIFSALSPAVPETSVTNFAGAKCRYKVDIQTGLYSLVLDK